MTDSETDPSAYVPEEGGVKKPSPFSKNAVFTIDDDFIVNISWEPATEEIIFQVEMPTDAYLAFAFGASMEECDMILFQSDLHNP